MKNYEDRRCAWGYITLCNECAKKIEQCNHLRTYRHIHIDKIVVGFPLGSHCEECGKKATLLPSENSHSVEVTS